LTSDLVSYVDGFGSGLGMPSGNDTRWLSPNVQAAAELIGLYSIPGGVQAGNQRSVKEEDTGAWVQLDFSGDLGPVPVRGNVGVRYVETETTATGLVSGTPVTITRKYDDTLPSLNLVFELHEDFLARIGLADVMARAPLGSLTPGGSLDSFNGPPFRYTAGNPGLEPYRATNLDLSLEWYFAEESLLSLAWFNKDVESFFQRSDSTIVPYSQSGLPLNLPPASSPLEVLLSSGADPDIEVSQTQNGENATVDGYEVIYQQAFTNLPGIWSGFGFTGNFTHVNSDEILGFSPDAYNATIWYDNGTISTRVSVAYRDAYQTQAPNATTGRDEQGYDKTTNVDFSLSYLLTEEWELTFEAINLTDE